MKSVEIFQHSYKHNYHGLEDIGDIELVLCNGLDIIHYILSNLPEVKYAQHHILQIPVFALIFFFCIF
jgi:hypothetical protein